MDINDITAKVHVNTEESHCTDIYQLKYNALTLVALGQYGRPIVTSQSLDDWICEH